MSQLFSAAPLFIQNHHLCRLLEVVLFVAVVVNSPPNLLFFSSFCSSHYFGVTHKQKLNSQVSDLTMKKSLASPQVAAAPHVASPNGRSKSEAPPDSEIRRRLSPSRSSSQRPPSGSSLQRPVVTKGLKEVPAEAMSPMTSTPLGASI